MGTRRKLAEVSDESLDGWRAFSMRHGTTPTALAEVLGGALAKLEQRTDDLPEWLRAAVFESRTVAAARRRRPRKSKA